MRKRKKRLEIRLKQGTARKAKARGDLAGRERAAYKRKRRMAGKYTFSAPAEYFYL
jgi:hypothetical protein